MRAYVEVKVPWKPQTCLMCAYVRFWHLFFPGCIIPLMEDAE
jgi:hypothetical protein